MRKRERERKMPVRIQSLRSSAIIDSCNLATDFDAAPSSKATRKMLVLPPQVPKSDEKYGHRRGQKMSKRIKV